MVPAELGKTRSGTGGPHGRHTAGKRTWFGPGSSPNPTFYTPETKLHQSSIGTFLIGGYKNAISEKNYLSRRARRVFCGGKEKRPPSRGFGPVIQNTKTVTSVTKLVV